MKSSLLAGLVIATGVLIPSTSPAQTELQQDAFTGILQTATIDDQIEKTAETLETEQDYSILAEDLIDLARNPVNLNKAKEDDLDKIPFLTPQQRSKLFDYLTTYGEVLSVFELQSIPGFDTVVIRKILPYIAISPASRTPAPTPANLTRFGRYDLLLRYGQTFPESSGYLSKDSVQTGNAAPYYNGSPQRYYFRCNYGWFDKLRIGFAGEKDPGEQFFRGAQPGGMDFYAAFLSLANLGILKNLTIGHFRVSYGQGLTLGSSPEPGSAPGFASGISRTNGIKPSLGMSEGSYLRGLATTLRIKRVEISGFASSHPRDATVSCIDSSSTLPAVVSSLSGTGYHRTDQELSKKNALKELVTGGNLSFSHAPGQRFGFRIGLTGVYYRYSASVVPKLFPYNRFVFRGRENLNTGVDFQLRYHGLYLFGEFSRSLNHGMAWIWGTIISPDPRVAISLICRNYRPGYQNLFSNAFGQNTLNAGERGIYMAVNAAIHPRMNISTYIDVFSFPWLKYRVDAPTSGLESGLLLSWIASKKVSLNFRFTRKTSRNNGQTGPDQILHKLCDNRSTCFRAGLEWHPVNGLVFKSRFDVKEFRESGSNVRPGYLAFQEAQVKALKWLESITVRYALFDVPHYAVRIYAYEPEVLYGYSVPAFQGCGMRTCVVLKFVIRDKIIFWVRTGITNYTDRQTVGSGPDLTESNVRADLTAQLMIKL